MLLAVWAFTPQAEIHRCHQAVTGTKAKKNDLAPLAPQASVLQIKSQPYPNTVPHISNRKEPAFPASLQDGHCVPGSRFVSKNIDGAWGWVRLEKNHGFHETP